MEVETSERLPMWVPDPVRDYLAHTVEGRSIRALARDRQVHPSTILRQVRSCEARREDPLVDAALKSFSDRRSETKSAIQADQPKRTVPSSAAELEAQTIDVLRRLCEPGAVMAVARGMETAVVVREDAGGDAIRTAVVDSQLAQVLALQNWISSSDPSARIARYFITSAGRTEMRRLMARNENRANGLKERHGGWTAKDDDDDEAARAASRIISTETPLISLGRRRDKTGKPFLNRDQVRVGERLREDFVLSEVGPQIAEDWRAALADDGKERPPGVTAARERVSAALHDLGPGLQDVALRCCCLLEGLEVTERAMGWSARSGKVVLRIALERLRRHYDEIQGGRSSLIG